MFVKLNEIQSTISAGAQTGRYRYPHANRHRLSRTGEQPDMDGSDGAGDPHDTGMFRVPRDILGMPLELDGGAGGSRLRRLPIRQKWLKNSL